MLIGGRKICKYSSTLTEAFTNAAGTTCTFLCESCCNFLTPTLQFKKNKARRVQRPERFGPSLLASCPITHTHTHTAAICFSREPYGLCHMTLSAVWCMICVLSELEGAQEGEEKHDGTSAESSADCGSPPRPKKFLYFCFK